MVTLNQTQAADARRGFIAALGAFFIWGLLPLYLKLLQAAPATQIMAHRVVWCCLLVFIWLALRGDLGHVAGALRDRAMLRRLAMSSVLVSLNWLVYVWAVNSGHIVESSLGYFINPLVSVLLGVFVLSERLNRVQWAAVSIAAAGVAWLTWQVGHPPWIALTLAVTFGLYGLIRKGVAVDSVAGLGVETLLVAPFGLAWLIYAEASGSGAFAHNGLRFDLLLIASGAVTAVPLVFFAYGVRRIPLSTVGLLQYLGPTLQLLCGVLVFHEPFTRTQAVGFGLIWAALAVYASEGLWRTQWARRPALAAMPVEAK